MSRLARLVIPGLPHHITQRGNRRQRTFFSEGDYAAYLKLMADWRGLLNSALNEEQLRDLRDHGRTGCPLGNATFVERLEQAVGRILRPRKPGRPPKLLKNP